MEKYLCTKILGDGECGKIMLCENKLNNEKVVIKIMNKTKNCHMDFIKSDVSISLLVGSSHKNLLQTIEAFVNEKTETGYIVSKYIENSYDMLELINDDDKMDYLYENIKIMIDIFVQITDALNYLHNLDILHLDIKPDNVIINDTYTPVLIDYGLSCTYETYKYEILNCMNYKIFGTFVYISPEVLNVNSINEIGQYSDIFSLGILFYLVYTKGRHPLKDTNLLVSQLINRRDGTFTYIDLIESHSEEDSYQQFSHVTIELNKLIRSMVSYKPTGRPSLLYVKTCLTNMIRDR